MKKCTSCGKDKPLDDFWSDKRRTHGKQARCKVCRTAETRAYRAAHPELNKVRYTKEKARERERHLIRKYGISGQAYTQMLNKQNGCCAICASPEKNQFEEVFHVDHCHTTGSVRGLLCRGCNHMLGAMNDDPNLLLRAIKYLVGPQVAAEVIRAYMECRPC